MNKNLKNYLEIADIHANRLEKAISHIKNLNITADNLTNLDDISLGFLELLTSRFAKLQDLIGTKIFSEILNTLQEVSENMSNLDKIYRLEKIGILPSAKEWISMRTLRNTVTHEYPDNPELMCENIKKVIEHAKNLLQYWQSLKIRILQENI